MMPTHREVLSIRNLRELRTLARALDLLSRQKVGEAADLLAQRVKAVERATVDGHWTNAQLLELIDPEGALLLEKDESLALAKEIAATRKLANQTWQGKGFSKGS
eukprot:5990188-Amphidinium_carterae.1